MKSAKTNYKMLNLNSSDLQSAMLQEQLAKQGHDVSSFPYCRVFHSRPLAISFSLINGLLGSTAAQ